MFFSFDLQKFNDEEWAYMTIYTTISDGYVQAFKQFTLYIQYLQGGIASHGPDKNELLLKRAEWSSDPIKLMDIIANYTS
jgi:hypothetical protein